MKNSRAKRQELRDKQRQRNTLIMLIAGGLLLLASGFTITKNMLANRADPSLIEVRGQPSLKVDQELIDFGDVKLNTNLTFELQLTNVGDQPLKISDPPFVEVKEGC